MTGASTPPARGAGPGRLVVAWSAEGPARAGADTLLRLVVGRFCGADPADIQVGRLCPRCGSGAHGRPRVAVVGRDAPHVSLSRAEGLVCVAVSDAGPVGVDCERVGAAEFTDFAAVGLHPLEHSVAVHDQTITWVRKESLVKATGDGLTVDLRDVRLTDPQTRPRLLGWDGPHPPADPVWMWDVAGPPGYVLAVTVLTGAEPKLTVLGAEQTAAEQMGAEQTAAEQLAERQAAAQPAADRTAAARSATVHRAAGQATAGHPTRQ